MLLAAEDSVIAQRAAFADEPPLGHRSTTPTNAIPPAPLVNQSSAWPMGCPAYIADDENIDGERLVLWHTFGLTHFPRLEDWPIMPVDTTGFSFAPYGFFDRNPTLDVPSMSISCHHGHGHC